MSLRTPPNNTATCAAKPTILTPTVSTGGGGGHHYRSSANASAGLCALALGAAHGDVPGQQQQPTPSPGRGHDALRCPCCTDWQQYSDKLDADWQQQADALAREADRVAADLQRRAAAAEDQLRRCSAESERLREEAGRAKAAYEKEVERRRAVRRAQGSDRKTLEERLADAEAKLVEEVTKRMRYQSTAKKYERELAEAKLAMAQAEARHQMRSEDGDAFILSKKIMQLEREKLSMSMELQDVQAVLDDLEPSVQQLTVMQQKLEETQRLLAAELLRKEELTNTLQQYESSDSENEDISENETDPQSQLAGIQSETEALTRERDQLLHQLQQQQNQPPLSKLSS